MRTLMVVAMVLSTSIVSAGWLQVGPGTGPAKVSVDKSSSLGATVTIGRGLGPDPRKDYEPASYYAAELGLPEQSPTASRGAGSRSSIPGTLIRAQSA